jgi:hypothetical protein
MNIVFLSPEFPPNYYHFCVRLRELGAVVLGLGHTPGDSLRRELREALNDYFQVQDLHHYGELIRGMGYLTWHFGKIDRLDSLNEYWLETEARLRTDFNIEGPKIQDLPPVKRKSVMKEVFRQAGVPVARGQVYTSPEAARNFAAEVGYPLVAKPDIGVGAARTWAIRSETELERFLADSPEGYFLEEFVNGIIQTFDGLTDRDGNPVFFSSLQYSRGIMETVNENTDIYYYTLRRLPGDLEQAGRAILRAFGVRERFFHFEFFRTPEGKLLALEVNMRPPGGPTVDMFNFASDIDLYRRWAAVVTGTAVDFSFERIFHCAYVSRRNDRRYLHSHDAVVSWCGGRLVNHQPMNPLFRDAMGDYAYLVRAPELDEVIAMADFIQARADL